MKLGKIFKRLSLAIAGLFIVASTVSVSACSVAESHTITMINENEKGGTLFGEGTYKAGSDVTISYNANKGYKFDKWDIDGEIIKLSNKTYTFKMPNKDITIKGSFETKKYNVCFNVNGYQGVASVFLNGEPFNSLGSYTKYDFGTELTFSIEINQLGYEVLYWKLNDQTVADNVSSYTLTVPDKEVRLSAYVDHSTITLHYSSNMEGFSGYYALDSSGNEQYERSVYSYFSYNSFVITDVQQQRYINPVTGNKFAVHSLTLKDSDGNVLVSGYSSFGAEFPYTCPYYGTFNTTDKDLYCEVTFRDFVHIELISDHGDIGHPDFRFLPYGDMFIGYTKRLEAKPHSGYKFSGWYIDGELYSSYSTMSFVAEKNMTVEAKYVLA